MPRRHPQGRRRRPGRRPPNRGPRGPGPSQARGFTPFGLRSFYTLFLPGLQGAAKRRYFNEVACWRIGGIALSGAMLGYSWLGPLAALSGLGGGLAEKQRFYRR